MILRVISRLLFFIIAAVYVFVFILSLDGGGRFSILNVLAAIGGNTFWCVLVMISLAGSAGICAYMMKKGRLTNATVTILATSFIFTISMFVIFFLKAEFVLDWLYRIYVGMFFDGDFYSGSERLLQVVPFMIRTFFFFLMVNLFLFSVSFYLFKIHKLKKFHKV
ncbi:hypothetical protein EHN46_23600 [Salmonella enterica]|nr:hypothetical protein [Salmonella enterica]